MSRVRDHLEDANRHLAAAIEHHEAGSYHAARYRIGQAKKSVDDALGAELSDAAAPSNPTADQGAQVSDGHSPRGVDPVVSRLLGSVRAAARGPR
jgi:hypothetical protein